MPIPCAVLMCHAPIVIPAIGRTRAGLCAASTRGMQEAAERLCAHEPDVLVVISPHTPRQPTRWGIVSEQELSGDFGRFGVPEVALHLTGAPRAAGALRACAAAQGLASWQPPGDDVDHGALVPLHFVREAGFSGRVLLIALPYPGTGSEACMGRAIAAAAERQGERWAVLASGDMSHRLTPDAPAGFHPDAARFDRDYVSLIAAGELQRAASFDPQLRELAAEDVVDSVAVASGAVGFDARGHELLSYEGPFGVGYMQAVLHEANAAAARRADEPAAGGDAPPGVLLSIAREAIAASLRATDYEPPHLSPPWNRPRGVFVTLRSADGDLRGCIGHLEPSCADFARELSSCAVAAATRDSRFFPVQLQELAQLRLEVSVLSPPEPATERDLDPARFGLVVLGLGRRGVLLPQIDGISSVADQLAIATRKAGLSPDQVERLERFRVHKLVESRT